ncbi:MAG: Gfo/Idh/MocA family oxidoreductase [Planctomycetaceae bacterium]|nr:Gfo/Idh/MocA family oxidoreductase [Planctomycetaceae bacterium]
MTDANSTGFTRRDLLKTTGRVAAASALAGVAIPKHAYAAENNTVQVALIGCGGRGTGAAANSLSVSNGPTKLVAMADVFPEKLNASYNTLANSHKDKVDVSEDAKYIGFDAYKKAMDRLSAGDIAILTTPVAFRWVMFKYAIEKGLNVFMEKPTTVDGASTRKMLELAKLSREKGLKVGVGLMCRHCKDRGELFQRIKQGEIGDITLLRAYRCHPPVGSAFVPKRKETDPTELMYQIRNFHGFLWASGGCYSDFYIHNIDECCWMKDDWPVEAKGFGGRHYRLDYIDQNFDTYTTEFTFKDGAKLILEGRCMAGTHSEFASYAHGTKGSAIISANSHWPSKASTYKGQRFVKEDLTWEFGKEGPELNPYQVEWNDFLHAIRTDDKSYNECERGAKASLVTAMGRAACHTGKVITFDEMLNSDHEFAPQVAELTLDGPAPIQADKDGKYPVPMPGLKKREF